MNKSARTLSLSSRLKKVSLHTFILFLAISALLAIITVLSGNFGSFEFKVLITTSIVAAASICIMCCSSYASRSELAWPGTFAAVLTFVSAALLIGGSWAEVDSVLYWKTALMAGIFAVAAAHALALLGLHLHQPHAWLKPVTAVTIFTLATVINAAIVGETYDHGLWKIILVLAIIVVLETLVIPTLARLTNNAAETIEQTLQLTRRQTGIYADKKGRLYAVEPIPSEQHACNNKSS